MQVLSNVVLVCLQTAQRNGIRELRSVMRWLQNFPHSPEVIHAVVVALEAWVSDSAENRDKIIRDGYVSLLCKMFSVLDINSRPFIDLLSVMSSLVCDDVDCEDAHLISGMSHTPDSSSATTSTPVQSAVKSMLSSCVHIDLMKILSYKINHSVDHVGLLLLARLLGGMDYSAMRLFARKHKLTRPHRRPTDSDNVADMTRRISTVNQSASLELTLDALAENDLSVLEQRQQQSAIDVPTVLPDHTHHLQAMVNLAVVYVDIEWMVSVVCDVCVRLISWSIFSEQEKSEHVELLLEAGIMGIIAKCLGYYRRKYKRGNTDGLRTFDASAAVYKCLVVLAKLSSKCSPSVRSELLNSCLQHCVELLQGWSRVSQDFYINGDMLFVTCEAIAAMVYGSSLPTGNVPPQVAIENIEEICFLLEYRRQLHNISKYCTATCPYVEPVSVKMGPTCASIQHEGMFGLFRRKHSLLPSVASVFRLYDSQSSACDLPSCEGLSLTLSVDSSTIPHNAPMQVMIVREVDMELFHTWCLYGLTNSSGSKALSLFPTFPFISLDLKSGNVSRSGVNRSTHPNKAGLEESEGYGEDIVEEVMPAFVTMSGTKQFRVDVNAEDVTIACNEIVAGTWTFHDILHSLLGRGSRVAHDNTDADEGQDADGSASASAYAFTSSDGTEEKTANEPSVAPASPGADSNVRLLSEDTAEHFLNSVLAAVALEQRVSSSQSSHYSGGRRTSTRIATSAGTRGATNRRRNSSSSEGDWRRRQPVAWDDSSDDVLNIPSAELTRMTSESHCLTQGLAVFLTFTPTVDVGGKTVGSSDDDDEISGEEKLSPPVIKSDVLLVSVMKVSVSVKTNEMNETSATDASTVVPVVWQHLDNRRLQISADYPLSVGSVIKYQQGNEWVGGKAVAMTTGTTSGVHSYQFTICATATPDTEFHVGVSTTDIVPLMPDRKKCSVSSPSFSALSLCYSSCGLIHLSLPASSHPALEEPVIAPVLSLGDRVDILLVQEGVGSARVFHNGQQVFVIENLHSLFCHREGLAAFVCCSNYGDAIGLKHLAPDLTKFVNWKWLRKCFSTIRDHRLGTAETFLENLLSDHRRGYVMAHMARGRYLASYHPDGEVDKLLSLYMAIGIVQRNVQKPDLVVDALKYIVMTLKECAELLQSITASPTCHHNHSTTFSVSMLSLIGGHGNSPSLSQKCVVPSWTVRCPMVHDVAMFILALISSTRICLASASATASASCLLSIRQAVSEVLKVLVSDTLRFPASQLLNLGMGHLVADLMATISRAISTEDMSIVRDVVYFVSVALNCVKEEDYSGEHHSAVTHMLVASGIVRRLGEVSAALLCADECDERVHWKQMELCERIALLIGEVLYRAHGNTPRRLLDHPRGGSMLNALTDSDVSTVVVYDNHDRCMNLLQQLVQQMSWHGVVCTLLSPRLGDVPELPFDMVIKADFIPSALTESMLLIVLAGQASYDLSSCSICFDLRTQSTAHVWHQSPMVDKRVCVVPSTSSCRDQGEFYTEEIRVIVTARAGNVMHLSNRDAPEKFWSSEGVALPQSIEVKIPPGEEWTDIELLQHGSELTFQPRQLSVTLLNGDGIIKELQASSTHSGWQSILSHNDMDFSKIPSTHELTIRIDILKTYGGAKSCRLAGLRVVSKTPVAKSLLGLRRMVALPPISQPNIIDIMLTRTYRPVLWKECVYFALMDGSVRAVESLIDGREVVCNQRNMFSGYGPWLWGHPGNTGNVALCVPCSLLSAVEQLLELGFSSPAVYATVQRAVKSVRNDTDYADEDADTTQSASGDSSLPVLYPEEADRLPTVQAASVRPRHNQPVDSNAHLDTASRLARRYRGVEGQENSGGRLNYAGDRAGAAFPLAMTTVATIAAIRSMVRDEIAIRLPHSLLETLEQSMRSIQQTTELLNSRRLPPNHASFNSEFSSKRKEQIPPSGPVEYLFKKADGTECVFDASHEACAEYGLYHGQIVRSHRYPELGAGTVVGVLNGRLWIHLEKDVGATYRGDNWQFADMYVLGEELLSESNALIPSRGRTLVAGRRVRRGRNWQWHNQDGFGGNLGTVVAGDSNDFWVSVEWDGGGTNTYRWGADGQYDLEIVDNEDGHIRTARGIDGDDGVNLCGTGVSVNEALVPAEGVRRSLIQTDNFGSTLMELLRHAARNGHSVLYHRAMSAVCFIASYDLSSTRCLQLCLGDVIFLLDVLTGRDKSGLKIEYSDCITCAKLLSVLTSTGSLSSLVSEPLNGRHFPFSHLVTTLSRSGTCSALVTSSLCLLRLLVRLGTSKQDMEFSSEMDDDERSQSKEPIRIRGQGSDGKRIPYVSSTSAADAHTDSNLSDGKRRPYNGAVIRDSNSEVAQCIAACLRDTTILAELLGLLLPILRYHQSASAIVIVVDILTSLLSIPKCFPLLVQLKVEAVLVELANQLNVVEVTGSSKTILELVTSIMITIEERSNGSMLSLLGAILQFASLAKDFDTVVQILNAHIDSCTVIASCIEILLGGRRTYSLRPETSHTWRRDLQVGSKIDAKDKSQLWYEAVIKNINDNDEVFVHYMGWGSKYDEWIPRMSDRLQISHSETGYWRENLRLDDPVEILCLHQEGSETKRRWFRGVVIRIEAPDRLLIEYDKRGTSEERWVSLSVGEDVCKVGTHVPSSLGPNSDILRTQRKNKLLQAGTFETVLTALERHLDHEPTVLACLETLQYLISDDDDIALTCGQLMKLKPAELLCSCLAMCSDSGRYGWKSDNEGSTEDIIDAVCSILLALCTSQDTKSFALGDAVDAQWKRKGNQAFPGKITRVYDDGMTFDIVYDDGDREERVLRDRIMHKSGACYYNSSSFLREVIACDGHIVLINVLKSYEYVRDKLVLIPVLSVLSAIVERCGDKDARAMDVLMALQIPTVAFDILDVATECKSSCRLAKQCLVLLQRISSYSVQNKSELYHMGAHRACIRCVNAFPSQPSVLASSLGLLASIISKDGVFHYPKCMTSNGEMDFGSHSDGEIYSSFWQSEDRLPTLVDPHWIDIDVSSCDR